MAYLADFDTDYPRPQFARERWLSLNGWWEFAFDDADFGRAKGWQGRTTLGQKILVPFPYQSARSGIGDKEIHEIVWYSREFEVPADWQFESLLLHFCAVDYHTEVWVNGRFAGANKGGHVPFHFDIARSLVPGRNHLSLRVEDRQTPQQPRGKQSSSGKPVRIYYYCTTGIWQTVWLEPVSATRMDSLRISTCPRQGTIRVDANVRGAQAVQRIEMEVFADFDSPQPLGQASAEVFSETASLELGVGVPRAWRPADPHLYRLRLRLFSDDALVDTAESYAGIRSFEARGSRFYLNDEPVFLLMILDQGYWPDTLLASASPQHLIHDVQLIKRFGFNAVRKHQKIEDERWLYFCDRHGLLVWEEMPNSRSWSHEAEEMLLSEWQRVIVRDANHPCIVTWVAVVESFGFPEVSRAQSPQYEFLEKIIAQTLELDPTRPVIDNDGWEHTESTHICSIHDYSQPPHVLEARYSDTQRTGQPPGQGWYKSKPLFLRGGAYRGQPIVLSEVGGFLSAPQDASEKRDRLFDYYGSAASGDELFAKYQALMRTLSGFSFLAGVCYTQFTDIEHETNGLVTCDRIPKVAPEAIAKLHGALFHRRL